MAALPTGEIWPQLEEPPQNMAPQPRREKDPNVRVARKKNKRQKYKERQAKKPDLDPVAPHREACGTEEVENVTQVAEVKQNAKDSEESDMEEAVAPAPASTSDLLKHLQQDELEKKRRALEKMERGEIDELTDEDLALVRNRKRVYSAWIGDVGDQSKRPKIDPVGLQVRDAHFHFFAL